MTARVAVVGGGVIGLSAAREAAVAGHDVVVVDPEVGRGATWVAAGMLAPLSELEYGHEALFRLNLAAARRWPTWAADLEATSGRPVGYRRSGSLLVAKDRDDREVLRELASFAATLGEELPERRGRECREIEPFLAAGLAGGLVVDGDHSVDPRALVSALLADLDRLGVERVAQPAAPLQATGDRVRGVDLVGGGRVDADEVVVAAGVRSRALLAELDDLPVRPVKGERLLLRAGRGHARVTRVVRAIVRGSSVYVVPRGDGDHVVGATVLEVGEDTTVTAGGVWELLRDAREVLPGVTEWELVESIAGLRPGTPDNGPVVGRLPGVHGVVLATGHHRNGVLLAPLTADTVVDVLAGRAPAPEVAPFGRERLGR